MPIEKMESLGWFTGPKWLLDERDWPPQPELKTSKDTHSEYKDTELVLFNNEREADKWDDLLNQSSYWRTLRVTAWMLRFVGNCRTKSKKKRKIGPLNTDEILNARKRWVKRVQDGGQTVIKSPGWKLEKDPQTEILTCKGRVKNYQPIYLGGGIFVSKLMLGGNPYPIEQTEENTDELTAMNKRLVNAKEHAWQRWKKEYVNALMEVHRSRTTGGRVPEVGDILLIIGDSKNRGE